MQLSVMQLTGFVCISKTFQKRYLQCPRMVLDTKETIRRKAFILFMEKTIYKILLLLHDCVVMGYGRLPLIVPQLDKTQPSINLRV